VKPASRASSKTNSNKSAMNDTFDLDSSLEDDLTLPPTNLKKTKGKATKPNSTVSSNSKVPSTYRNIVKSSAESSSDSPNPSPIRRNKGRTLKNTVKAAVKKETNNKDKPKITVPKEIKTATSILVKKEDDEQPETMKHDMYELMDDSDFEPVPPIKLLRPKVLKEDVKTSNESCSKQILLNKKQPPRDDNDSVPSNLTTNRSDSDQDHLDSDSGTASFGSEDEPFLSFQSSQDDDIFEKVTVPLKKVETTSKAYPHLLSSLQQFLK
jgi:hypothetical protein